MLMGTPPWRKIEDITDIDELFLALTKRKYWSCMPHGILRQIFDNANGDVEKVQRFRFVSERHHCVENNFIPLLEGEYDPEITISLFSVTLERLAAQAAQSVPELPERSWKRDIAIETAETAYMASILCNPLMLGSYAGLALFYMFLGSFDRAAQVCRDYDAAEQRLLSSDMNDLNHYDQGTKSNVSTFREWIELVKIKLGI